MSCFTKFIKLAFEFQYNAYIITTIMTNYLPSLFPAAHLRPPPRVARNAKTLSAISLMDCTEQGLKSGDGGGATVQLDSYESTCDEKVPLHPSPPALAAASTIDKGATATMATVAIETLPLSPSIAAKEEEEKKEEEGESKEEPKPPAGAQAEEVKKEEGKIINVWHMKTRKVLLFLVT